MIPYCILEKFALSCENLSLEVLRQNIDPFYNDIDGTISCWLNAVHKSLILVTKARKIVANIFGVQNASSISPLALVKAFLKIIPLYVLIELIYGEFYWELSQCRIVNPYEKIDLIPMADESSDKFLSVRIFFNPW